MLGGKPRWLIAYASDAISITIIGVVLSTCRGHLCRLVGRWSAAVSAAWLVSCSRDGPLPSPEQSKCLLADLIRKIAIGY